MKLLAALLHDIRSKYGDTVAPGLVLSELDGCTGEIYASVCRYPNGHHDKRLVCKAKADSVPEAIRMLAIVWLIEHKEFKLGCAARTLDADLTKALR